MVIWWIILINLTSKKKFKLYLTMRPWISSRTFLTVCWGWLWASFIRVDRKFLHFLTLSGGCWGAPGGEKCVIVLYFLRCECDHKIRKTNKIVVKKKRELHWWSKIMTTHSIPGRLVLPEGVVWGAPTGAVVRIKVDTGVAVVAAVLRFTCRFIPGGWIVTIWWGRTGPGELAGYNKLW